MAAAFRALESRKTGQGRAEKGVLGGEDVQSDHTHLTMCREERTVLGWEVVEGSGSQSLLLF